jgi:membrane protease YdiL (CAAX protease family)
MQIGYSFLIGAMCSVVLFKTANLWLCVALHAIYDFCGLLVPTLGDGSWWDVPTIVFTAVLAVATTAYMVVLFARMKPEEIDRIYRESE